MKLILEIFLSTQLKNCRPIEFDFHKKAHPKKSKNSDFEPFDATFSAVPFTWM